jgi:hypothetical protein
MAQTMACNGALRKQAGQCKCATYTATTDASARQ